MHGTHSPLSRARHSAAFIALAVLSGPVAAANEALMDLFKLLHAKGTLDAQEYEMLVSAARADEEKVAHEQSTVKNEVKEQVARVEKSTANLAWAEKVKLKGDVRTRYEYMDEDDSTSRTRGRFRYRLGVIAQPLARWEVGAGLTSGGDDQRSNNQSFDETFSTKDIRLNYAYMQHDFGNGLKAIAGKYPYASYLYVPTDVMWDTDINPEGMSLNYTGGNGWGTWFANGGVWVLEEVGGSGDDPYMGYGQVGQMWGAGGWTGTLAAAVYGFGDVNEVADFTKSEGTNTDSNLSSFNLNGELGHALGGGNAKVIGEYIRNFDTDSQEDTAWALGAKYAIGKWGVKYLYADVDANAVPDFLPDSDRLDGLTDIYGHELEVTYALFEKVVLGLDLYSVTDDPTGVDQVLVQADLNVKF